MDVDRIVFPQLDLLKVLLQWSHVLMDVDRAGGLTPFTVKLIAQFTRGSKSR